MHLMILCIWRFTLIYTLNIIFFSCLSHHPINFFWGISGISVSKDVLPAVMFGLALWTLVMHLGYWKWG